MINLSKNLQYLMEINNINKSQLSKILSIPSMSIGRWVNGKVTDPSLSKLLSLSRFFGVGIDDLVMRNLELQNDILDMYKEYINIPLFEWTSDLTRNNDEITSTIRIPKILIVGDSKDIFSVAHSPQYDGVFPSNSLLVFTKATELKVNDVLLVRNKALNNLLFIRYRGIDYGSVLTHEKVEIDQYKIEGIMVNMILDNVFLNLPK